MLETPPLSLYVHFPWCVKKCPYCDFNSHGLRDEPLPQAQYVDALLTDLRQDLIDINVTPIQSIFFGGGTPSLMDGQQLHRFLNGVRDQLPLADDIEITLEANPGTVDSEHFDAYRKAGVNRLSIGIQSFNSAHLKTLGRIHSGAEAEAAVTTARNAGFTNFNLDFMFGLPNQTVAQALDDLRHAISLKPTHLSWYQLTLEPNTAFHQNPPALPDDELIWDMQEAGQALLAEHGFEQYEISAYAQTGQQARHNLNYWSFGDYLGIGAGAHGKVTHTQTGEIIRRWKTKHPDAYLGAAHSAERIQGQRVVLAEELISEFAMNGFRLKQGFSSSLFEQRTGLSSGELIQAIETSGQSELIERSDTHIRCSDLGWAHLNTLLEALI